MEGKMSASNQRKLNIDFSNINVRRAVTEEDIEQVYQLIWQGYKKYFNDISEIRDEYNNSCSTILLLATNNDNQPLGTMRILDRNHGKIELDSFIDVDKILSASEMPCTEATRLSVPSHPDSLATKLALYKVFFTYCNDNQISTMIISARPELAANYTSFLYFEDIGEKGVYGHSLLGGKEHRSFKLDLKNAWKIYRESNYPLYNFFCVEKHPNITY